MMPIRSPASNRAKPGPDEPLPEADARQGEAKDRGRGLHLCAVVPPRDEGQRLGCRANGLVGQLEIDPNSVSEGAAPAGEVLRRLTVDGVDGHELRPALRLGGCRNSLGEGAVGRKAAVAEAENGQGRVGCAVGCCQPVEKTLGRGRRRAVAIGRGQHDDPVGRSIAFWREGRHRCCVHPLPGLRQCGVERGRKSPGAAALAADEQDRLGTSRGLIASDARPTPPSREPDDNASHAHGRDAERHQPQNEAKRRRALSGVQHVDGFRNAFPPGQVGPGQQRTGALIEIPGPLVGLQREDVRRIAGIGKAQLPQFVDGRLHQKGHLTRCERRLTAHLNRHGWHAATGKQIECGRRHPQGGGRRHGQGRPPRCGRSRHAVGQQGVRAAA